MKICPKCQQIMEDSFEFCGRCGSGLDYLSSEEEWEAAVPSGKAPDEMSLEEINEALDRLVAEQNLKADDDYIDDMPVEDPTMDDVSSDAESGKVPLPSFGDEEEPQVSLPEREGPPLKMDDPEEEPVRREPPLRRETLGARDASSDREAAPVQRRRPEGHRPPSIRSLQGEDDDAANSNPAERRRPVGHRPPSIRRANGEEGPDAEPSAGGRPVGHRPPSVNRQGNGAPSGAGASASGGRPVGHRPPSINRAASQRTGNESSGRGARESAESQQTSDADRFTPLPPFVTAEEASRPSPFAPAKPNAFADDKDDKKSSKSDSSTPRSTYITSTSGELAASTKVCPICYTRCYVSDKNCKNCGYQFPSSGVMATLGEKNVNIIGILASIAMGASVFVNFITYVLNGSQVEFALISKVDGYAFLALAALSLVLSCFGRNMGVIVVGTLSVLASWVENWFIYYDVTQVKKGGKIDNEIGFYLLVAGAALILISGIVGKVKEKKKADKLMSLMTQGM